MTGEELRQVRRSARLSQRRLAFELGYRYGNTVYRKEHGERAVTLQDVIILKLLGFLPRDYWIDYYGGRGRQS